MVLFLIEEDIDLVRVWMYFEQTKYWENYNSKQSGQG